MATQETKSPEQDNELVDQGGGYDLPYATDFVNAACYCLETLNGIDGKLLSKKEENQLAETKKIALHIISKAMKDMYEDYCAEEELEEQETVKPKKNRKNENDN
jgi:hypothetical protein